MAARKCELHGTVLTAMDVPISYGLPGFDPAWEVEKELFPNARSYILGGCLIDFNNPTTARRMVCEECRNAKDLWRRENGLTDAQSENAFDI